MRVLMTTMKLDIGGAETHIVELSKALARRGVDVTVASNGGAYVEELENAGIKHVKIPFHSKNPASMFKAYKLLKNLIFEEKFDIVHAHARIPAFLCALLNKKYHFRFVTTAHWVFSTAFPYNFLTRWGERSLAVSDDIKDYLVKNYGTNPDNIRVTINGIDLEKFSKDTDCSLVCKEFSLSEDKKRIVYVSRMDIDRSYAAHKLIEITENLYSKIDNLEIIIVGGGNDYDTIKREADAVNARIGKRVIVTTGSRTDINRFTALADVFVGVSRAALEAMASGKPSIIAGNEGYIGVFDEDKLQVSIDTNFCCRGCEMTSAEVMERDILKIMNSNKEEQGRLGKYSRNTVKKYYSIDTMADDAIKMYISSIKDTLINEVSVKEFDDIDQYLSINPLRKSGISSDVVISGYYGFGNSGDDSILYSMIRELKANRPDIRIVTLSNTPEKTSKLYGVASIYRFNIISVIAAISRTKLLISGGGSLIQDVTSSKSLIYYLSVIRLAQILKKKVLLLANGIGPIEKVSNKNRVKKVLNKVDFITLREPASLDELKGFGVDKPQILVTADPAFNLYSAREEEVEAIMKANDIPPHKEYCVVAIRPWFKSSDDLADEISSAANYAFDKYGLNTIFLVMQPSRDMKISKECASKIESGAYVVETSLSPAQILGIVKMAKFVIGMRLHTLIYGASCGTPVIGISYDPKINAVMDYIGQNRRVLAENLNSDDICGYIDEIMENHKNISDELLKKANEFSAKASENIRFAIDFIK